MVRRSVATRDYSEHLQGELDYVLDQQVQTQKEYVPTVTAEAAMAEARLLQHQTCRDVVRVLFISTDETLLNPAEQSLDGYLKASDTFDEVHILILRHGLQPKQQVLRPEKNVYLYTAASEVSWLLPKAAMQLIQAQLVFADGFRPDLVVARDPFWSAIVAWWLRRLFGRATQLHVLTDVYKRTDDESWWSHQLQKWWMRIVLPRFASVRTMHNRLSYLIAEKYNIPDLAKLPKMNPYEGMADAPKLLDLKKQYPQYVFSLLFVGSLDDPSAAMHAIAASAKMLQNKTVCLLIVGDGRGRKECETYAKQFGVLEQIIFIYKPVDVVQYLKEANVLIQTDTSEEGEEVVLQAATVGVPMLLAKTSQREDLFTHKESAFLCDLSDPATCAVSVEELMNGYALRQHLAEQAAKVVQKYMYRNRDYYLHEYRASIEAALFAESIAAGSQEESNT